MPIKLLKMQKKSAYQNYCAIKIFTDLKKKIRLTAGFIIMERCLCTKVK